MWFTNQMEAENNKPEKYVYMQPRKKEYPDSGFMYTKLWYIDNRELKRFDYVENAFCITLYM